MSQVLALIVAASVLMMTALTVIFMVQGGLGSFGDTVNQQGCTGAINAQCSATDAPSVSVPSACTSNGEATQTLAQNSDFSAGDRIASSDTVSCD